MPSVSGAMDARRSGWVTGPSLASVTMGRTCWVWQYQHPSETYISLPCSPSALRPLSGGEAGVASRAGRTKANRAATRNRPTAPASRVMKLSGLPSSTGDPSGAGASRTATGDGATAGTAGSEGGAGAGAGGGTAGWSTASTAGAGSGAPSDAGGGAAGVKGAPPLQADKTSSSETPPALARAWADRCTIALGTPSACEAAASISLFMGYLGGALRYQRFVLGRPARGEGAVGVVDESELAGEQHERGQGSQAVGRPDLVERVGESVTDRHVGTGQRSGRPRVPGDETGQPQQRGQRAYTNQGCAQMHGDEAFGVHPATDQAGKSVVGEGGRPQASQAKCDQHHRAVPKTGQPGYGGDRAQTLQKADYLHNHEQPGADHREPQRSRFVHHRPLPSHGPDQVGDHRHRGHHQGQREHRSRGFQPLGAGAVDEAALPHPPPCESERPEPDDGQLAVEEGVVGDLGNQVVGGADPDTDDPQFDDS